MSFLKAQWNHLVLVNYEIDPVILEPYLPYGTQVDLHEGKCFVSLVAFLFKETAVLGVKWPGHVNFEEANLRFYVTREDGDSIKRGVVFIKEIVPKHLITLVANTLYSENYETMKMEHHLDQNLVEYRFGRGTPINILSIELDSDAEEIEEGSHAEFITEHYWGYAKITDKKTNEYEVRHPRWNQRKVQSSNIDIDYGDVYGKDFAFLSGTKPYSILYCKGSEITVEPGQKLGHNENSHALFCSGLMLKLRRITRIFENMAFEFLL